VTHEPGADPVRDVPISGESIPLGAFLKLARAAETGGRAKQLIQSGLVSVNGAPETRRRRQLRPGDVVRLADGRAYRIVAQRGPVP
jgi:ribosome-associated protein